eukprot:15375582-Alexandrium_andersonii.AAC.1
MSASLVGSEMCIRDSSSPILSRSASLPAPLTSARVRASPSKRTSCPSSCLLYTSDAADDM